MLVLKDKLSGRVQEQIRIFEQHSLDNTHNRSSVQAVKCKLSLQDKRDDNRNIFMDSLSNTPEQRIIEEALIRGSKIVLPGTRTGEVARSVKRLQKTPIRRWKELEKRHNLSPRRLLFRKKSEDKIFK